MKTIKFVVADTNTPKKHKVAFLKVYKEVFAGAPYFEKYKLKAIERDTWLPHLEQGVTILAFKEEQLIGFGCAMPLPVSSKEVQQFIAEREGRDFDVSPEKVWYMSEVGVLEAHRERGIGTALIQQRLEYIVGVGGLIYLMRTAAKGSNSIRLYERFGSKRIGIQDVSGEAQVQINKSQSDERIYLFGNCVSAIEQIARISQEYKAS